MKKKTTLLITVLALTFTFAVQNAIAQTRIGGFLAYGTEIETLGLGAVGEFFVNENIAIAPGLLYFFPKDLGGYDYTWFEINANGEYYFTTSGSAQVYGLAGLNFAFVSVDLPAAFGGNASSTEVGLNLGVGSNFDIGSSVLPFAELRFVIGNADQLVLSGGVKWTLQ